MTERSLLLAVVAVLLIAVYACHQRHPHDVDVYGRTFGDTARAEALAAETTTTTTTAPPTTTTSTTSRTFVSHPRRTIPAAPSSPVVDMIRAGFARFGPDVAEQAVHVAGCETGHTYDPHATNGAHAGLFQLSRTYHEERARRLGYTWSQMFEPGPNIAVAADLYAESGWGPWTCRYAA